MSTDLSKEEKAEKIFAQIKELKTAFKWTVKSYLVIGKNLDEINKEKLWYYYGDHIKKFTDITKELRISSATAYNCMRIYNLFGKPLLEKGYDVDYFRLLRLAPIMKDKDEAEIERWLIMAQDLLPQDFNNEIKKLKGGKDNTECTHSGAIEYYVKCLDCNKLLKQTIEQVEDRIKTQRLNEIQKQ